MNKYESVMLDYSIKLDFLMDKKTNFKDISEQIIKDQNKKDIIHFLNIIKKIILERKEEKEILKITSLLKESLISFIGYKKISKICDLEKEKDLEELLEELNELIGLKKVKDTVIDLILYQKIQRLRKKMNLKIPNKTLHLAFIGNPGTGKTTVARIIGKVYKQIGLLSKGHFMEVSRTDLIAGYQGQTAIKVKNIVNKARGGVLFIDEAYSITENDYSDSYGKECLTELTKALEDYREDLVVIVAGYPELMNKFFKSNPGLKSRFNTIIEFEDYTSKELVEILKKMCNKNDYKLDNLVSKILEEHLEDILNKKIINFSNGRMIRNIYENLIMNQARRVSEIENPTLDDLCIISREDLDIQIKL